MDADGGTPAAADDPIERAVLATVIAQQGIAVDDAIGRAGADLGHDPGDPVALRTTERAFSALVDRTDLLLLAPDRAIAPRDLLQASTLTHRVTAVEISGAYLSLACDLAPFAYHDPVVLADGADLELVGLSDGLPAWTGGDAWLDGYEVGDLVAVQVSADGHVSIATIAPASSDDAEVGDALAQRMRAAYDRERADPHLPALVDDIVFSLILEDPATFVGHGAPVSTILDAAGLDHRGPLVAHEATVWEHQARADRRRRVEDVAGGEPTLIDVIVRVLDIADLASGAVAVDVELGALDERLLTGALDALDDLDILAIVSGELLRVSDLVDQRAVTDGFVTALVDAATAPRHRAVARYLAALAAQQAGDAAGARGHLAAAHLADPDFPPAADLFGYYASVAGDASVAEQRWAACPTSPVIRTELEVLRALPPDPSLAERVPWMERKASGFIERAELARDDLAEVAFARATDPTDEQALRATLTDPLVFDAVLHEGGWFATFLRAMGELLPNDERTLFASWSACDRWLFAVQAVREDGGVELAPMPGGDAGGVVPVPKPPARSHGAGPLDVGHKVCGRVVPDGDGHRLVAGWFVVPSDVEADVVEILGDHDAITIALIAAELDARNQGRPDAIDLRDLHRVVD